MIIGNMQASITLFLFLALAREFCADDQNPIVQTLLGKVRGYFRETFNGRQFQAFEGIPYAQPPIGKLRFQPPQRALPWIGVLAATRPESECLQFSHAPPSTPERVSGSEDCLYLNIYKPSITSPSDKLLPVLFYIHGGAFVFGSGHSTSPEYLMDRDAIAVTINYRLGPLGFLSTGDNVVPGNMGLKDQSLALRWISENIRNFGGDPGKILLLGLSAGGVSVHYQYLSPMSRGLFRGGISFSGSALDCWAQTENAVEKAKKLADLLGCPTDNSKEMVKCLMTRPAKSIVQLVGNFMPWLFNPFTPFGPVVEKGSAEPFVDRRPVDIIASGDAADLPWLTSVTSEEGLYPAAEFVNDEKLMAELDEKWDSLAPHLLDFNFTIPQQMQVKVAEKIRKHYLDGKKIETKTALPLIHMVGDRLFVVDAEKAARMMAKSNKSPVWFYFYSYRGHFSLSDLFIPSKDNFGVSHGDDVFLILRRFPDPVVTEKDSLAVQKTLLDICVSFATNGVPDAGIEWPRIDPWKTSLQYLHIAGADNVKMDKNTNLGDKKFWESIDFDENRVDSTFGNSRDEF